MTEPNGAVLLYDGACGFCAGSVQWILRREPAEPMSALRFAPLQGAFAARLRDRRHDLLGIDSVIWYDPATDLVLVKSAAALAVARHLGGLWRVLGALGTLVPRPLRDWVYDQVAARRLRLAAPACLLPTAEQRRRFLD